jgi:hypothetical protein
MHSGCGTGKTDAAPPGARRRSRSCPRTWFIRVRPDAALRRSIAAFTSWHPVASPGIPWHPLASPGIPWHPRFRLGPRHLTRPGGPAGTGCRITYSTMRNLTWKLRLSGKFRAAGVDRIFPEGRIYPGNGTSGTGAPYGTWHPGAPQLSAYCARGAAGCPAAVMERCTDLPVDQPEDVTIEQVRNPHGRGLSYARVPTP